jgi:hypothetical protein
VAPWVTRHVHQWCGDVHARSKVLRGAFTGPCALRVIGCATHLFVAVPLAHHRSCHSFSAHGTAGQNPYALVSGPLTRSLERHRFGVGPRRPNRSKQGTERARAVRRLGVPVGMGGKANCLCLRGIWGSPKPRYREETKPVVTVAWDHFRARIRLAPSGAVGGRRCEDLGAEGRARILTGAERRGRRLGRFLGPASASRTEAPGPGCATRRRHRANGRPPRDPTTRPRSGGSASRHPGSDRRSPTNARSRPAD